MPTALHAIADRLRPTLRRQFLAAVAKLQARIPLEELARSVEAGTASVRIEAALREVPEDLRGAASTVNRVFEDTARAHEAALAKRFGHQSRFDLVNPRALDAALTGGQLITSVTEQTRLGINRVIAKAIETGIPPAKAARIIRPTIGLTTRQAQAVMNFQMSMSVAGAGDAAAMKAATSYADRLLRERAETIARTETIAAGRAGRNAVWEEAQRQGFLPQGQIKKWVVTMDDRLCPLCTWMQGQEVPLGEPYNSPTGTPVPGPPLHPRCRCTEILVVRSGRTAMQPTPRPEPTIPVEAPITDEMRRTLRDEIYPKAEILKQEIDALADRVANEVGGTVAKVGLKNQETALKKAATWLGGDVRRLGDIARNTIVVPKEHFNQAVALLRAEGVNLYVVTPRSNVWGYSGANGKYRGSPGILGEIQVNTPEMIFAKEKQETARAILKDQYAGVAARMKGLTAGRGHHYYEQGLVMTFGDRKFGPVASESRRYYDAVRKRGR